MNRHIAKITHNYHQYAYGENFYTAEVGKNGVIEINEIEPTEGNGLHYCVINYDSGKAMKVFNLDTISYDK